MIDGFLSSWELFYLTYLTGWSMGFVLSVTGVMVIARNQIFLGAAVSQASTLGVALGMWLQILAAGAVLAWVHSEAFLSFMAVAFCVMACLFTGQGADSGTDSYEAKTGWVFLISASGSVLVLSGSPHGLEEIHRLISSSIIGSTAADVRVFGALALATIVFLLVFREKLLLLAMDPAMAVAVGMNRRSWEIATGLWLGLVAGLSIRSAGMLYTFGCLVLPALTAKNLCKEVRPMFLVAPAAFLTVGTVGFAMAHHYDYPPAQMTVTLMGATLAAAWIRKKVPFIHMG